MARVEELLPGDIVRGPLTGNITFVTQVFPHPMSVYQPQYIGLALVIWRMPDESVSMDALDPRQYIGEVERSATVESLKRGLGMYLG